jgi:hypothetical protein
MSNPARGMMPAKMEPIRVPVLPNLPEPIRGSHARNGPGNYRNTASGGPGKGPPC